MSTSSLPVLPADQREQPLVGYLGIDFGTNNTHIAICYIGGNNLPQTVSLAGQSSIPTCLLCREPWEGDDNDDRNIISFGITAEQDWLQLSDADRPRHRLAANFKPDIVSKGGSASAQRDARAFLRQCCRAVRDGGMVKAVGNKHGVRVVVGVPAEVSQEQKDVTAKLAREAGFDDVDTIEEPLGALAFHLADRTLTKTEVRQGIVVIDFGGGTFDVAWVDSRHGLRAPSGDANLGGRWFDDLFYQWLLEQNPNIKELPSRDRSYLWKVTCRKLKESFSNRWKVVAGPKVSFVDTVMVRRGHYAEFQCSDVGEFFKRAEHYSPSPLASQYFTAAGPINLIDWIARTLERSFQAHPPDLGRVILTGGSSNWPFMRDMAAKACGVKQDRILISPQPEVTIGSGLSVYSVLKEENTRKQRKLHKELPEWESEFVRAVARTIDAFIEGTAAAVVSPVIACVEEVYLGWYHNGGTLNAAKQKVDAFVGTFDPKDDLKERETLLANDLLRIMRDHLDRWLDEHGIEREAEELVHGFNFPISGLLNQPADQIASIISEMVGTTLVIAICGAVYVAAHAVHIAISPWTGIPTLAATGILSMVGYSFIRDRVQQLVLDFDWGKPSLKALSLRLSEGDLRKQVAQIRSAMIQSISSILRNGPQNASHRNEPPVNTDQRTLDDLAADVVEQFVHVVKKVIEDLGVLEEVRFAQK